LNQYKSVDYFRIIPPPNGYNILKGISSEVELRDLGNAWPLKLLNRSFAIWSLKIIENTIIYIKKSYAKYHS